MVCQVSVVLVLVQSREENNPLKHFLRSIYPFSVIVDNVLWVAGLRSPHQLT